MCLKRFGSGGRYFLVVMRIGVGDEYAREAEKKRWKVQRSRFEMECWVQRSCMRDNVR